MVPKEPLPGLSSVLPGLGCSLDKRLVFCTQRLGGGGAEPRGCLTKSFWESGLGLRRGRGLCSSGAGHDIIRWTVALSHFRSVPLPHLLIPAHTQRNQDRCRLASACQCSRQEAGLPLNSEMSP